MVNSNLFYFSGTIGDAYIALCKLYDYALKTPCQLRRLCRTIGADPLIEEICKLFPNIEYVQPYIHFNSISEMRSFAEENRERYINIFYDGNGRGNEPDDPGFLNFSSFPKLNLPVSPKDTAVTKIGIQLNSGSRKENSKLLDINWVDEFCAHLHHRTLEVYVFGSGNYFSDSELNALTGLPSNVFNLFNKTSINKWLSGVASLDFFISPEGFPAFWALSQKVPSLIFYKGTDAVLRMSKFWRNMAICIKVEQESHDHLSGHTSRIYPLHPAHAASIVLTKLLPDLA